MNRIRLWLLLAALVLCSGIAAAPHIVSAQDATPDTPDGDADPETGTFSVTLEDMGLEEVRLRGAGSEYNIFFEMPQGWKPEEGTTLDLNVSYIWVGQDQEPGVLQVRLNQRSIGAINLLNLPSNGHVILEVPADAWELEPNAVQHILRFQSLTTEGCDERTEIIISPSSTLNLAYAQEEAPAFSLDDYPKPFYQNTFVPTPVLFVMPVQPTAQDLAAASQIAAQLGNAGGNPTLMQTVSAEAFDPAIHGTANVIVIGTPQTNPLVTSAAVSDLSAIPAGGGAVSVQPAPWNTKQAALVVTGESPEGVALAAHAISMPQHLPALTGNQAVITGVPPYQPVGYAPLTGTFRSFGYTDITRNVLGRTDLRYEFDLGAYGAAPGGYIEVNFAHSMPLDERQSSLTVMVNEVPVGSVALDGSNSNNGYFRVELPSNAEWWRGNNVIRLRADLYPGTSEECMGAGFLDLNNLPWITVFDTSTIFVQPSPDAQRRFDLAVFPRPFEEGNNLDNLVFVLPENPEPGAQDALVKVSARLASGVTVERFNQQVVFGQPDNLNPDSVVIAIGRPSVNAYTQSINGALAQPFEEGSDALQQSNNPLVFQFQPGQNYGVVQVVNPGSGAEVPTLVIAGTTDEHVRQAADFIADPDQSPNLFGNLLYVYGDKFRSFETRPPVADADFVPQVGPAGNTEPEKNPNSASDAQPLPLDSAGTSPIANPRPIWLIPSIVGTSALLLLLLVGIGWYRNYLERRRGVRQ